jgi:hypothetical protein
MATVIPGEGMVVSIEYPANGLDWARLYDNLVLGWYVDETTPVPLAPPAPPPVAPHPCIIGHFPTHAPDTSPIISPQWAKYVEPTIFVPDLWRGSFPEFLTWLATNNGAFRPLESRIRIHTALYNGFEEWARHNPDLVYAG